MDSRPLVAAVLTTALLSCDKSPTAVTPVQPPATQPVIQNIRIAGPDGVAPGGTARYSVIARLSNGSEQDVTASSSLISSDYRVLSIAPNGVATARQPGQAVLAASNGPHRAGMDVLVLVPGTFRLTGVVREGDLPLADVTVDLLNGSLAAMSTRTDESGSYQLFGLSGFVEIRASKNGYATQVNRLTVTSNTTSDFNLADGPAPEVQGTYTLTITAAADCPTSGYLTLPAELRTRTYTAAIHQNGSIVVDLSGATLVKHTFAGDAHGTRVAFVLRGVEMPDFYYYFDNVESSADFLERLSSTDLFEVVGHVDATLSQTGISGTLTGLLAVVSGNSAYRQPRGLCFSTHAFVMSRR